MPRFFVAVCLADPANGSIAAGLSRRQPEIAVEHQWCDHDDERRVLSVCCAPSPEHVKAWVRDAAAELLDLRVVHPTQEHTR